MTAGGSAAQAGGTARLDLEGEIAIHTADETKQQLLAFVLEHAAGGAALELGLADVTDLDTAGLQLLLFARVEADRRGATLTCTDAGAAVLDALAIVRLGGDLRPLASAGTG